MKKIIIGWALGGVIGGVATQVAAAPVEDEAAAQLVNRLNQLEQEVRNLRGKNQELYNQVETLQQNQKDGFLQVDERVQKLEVPGETPVRSERVQSSQVPAAPAPVPAPVPAPAPRAEPVVTSEGIQIPDPANSPEGMVGTAEKVSPESSDSYYYYGTEKTAEDRAEKPVKPVARPAATSLRSSDVTPSAPLIPANETQADIVAGEAYNTAYKLLLARPAQAVPAFEEFLRQYPSHPLAANAQYWLGEALYAQDNYARAVDEFAKVLQRYKNSAKAPDAALKMGYAFYELKRWEMARQSLEDTIEYFPSSNAARLAQARIEQMTSEGF
ncbi:tol-pal system protein YbgF [Thiofilum flexile]|uniref:tol-pal system protein YbgF n=1 Tax=Thiofilum flexile TaxID=125627 RepID=UPI00037CD63A|nr:tol-pal system protein YbgF [Thiofilum flexile]